MSNGSIQFGDKNWAPFYSNRIWSGEDTPAHLRAKGEFNKNNAYSVDRTAMRQSPAGTVYHQGMFQWQAQACRNLVDFVRPGAPSYAPIAVHLSDVLEKWKSTELNLGVTLGEGKESLEMVGNRLLSLARGARSIRKGDLGGALRQFGPVPRGDRIRAATALNQKDTSRAFLELHLGWSPLIGDIYEGLNIPEPRPIGQKIKSKRRLGTLPNGQVTVSNLDYLRYFTVKDHICQSRIVCSARNKPTWFQRFGLNNPAAIAWELVPMSFVVDYFLPIGDTIAALEAVALIEYEYLLLQKFERYYCFLNVPAGASISPYGYKYFYNATSHEERLIYQRSRPNVSFPAIVAESVNVSLPTSIWKVATMAALAHQQLGFLDPDADRVSRRKFATFRNANSNLSVGNHHWLNFL